MVFVPRTFDQILADMVAFTQSRTELSDFTVGSVIRTILEAAALEDDEQYFQMVQLLDSFSLMTASGSDLDRRLADFGVARLSSQSASGSVAFYNSNLTTDEVSVDLTTSSTDIVVYDSSDFPTSGYPYTVRIGEGLSYVQDVLITANNTATNALTISTSTPLLAAFSVGTRVSLVTGASSYVVSIGTDVEVPATVSEPVRKYVTRESATISAGNYASNSAVVSAHSPGASSNVGANRVSRFSAAAPFPGALVSNVTSIEGGADTESDVDFRKRAIDAVQSLSRGTPNAVRSGAVGVSDAITGKRVLSSNIVEDFTADEVYVYVDDGSGSAAQQTTLVSDSLNGAVAAGISTLTLYNSSDFPSAGTLLITQPSPAKSELVVYESNVSTSNILTLSAGIVTSGGFATNAIVYLVDVLTDSAETGQRRFALSKRSIVRGTEKIYVNDAGGAAPWRLLTSADYVINRGTGEIKLTSTTGVAAAIKIVASYSYYTNLVSEVQRVLEGDLTSPVAYPGVKAAGILLSVESPTVKRVTLQAVLTVETGYVEADLAPTVQLAIEDYINALAIGEDIILSKVIEAAHNIVGVRDFVITSPTSNITVLESELASPYDASANSLISVQ